MWIQLTQCDGQAVMFNCRHLVAIKAHGERCLVTHVCGTTLVEEGLQAIAHHLNLKARHACDGDETLSAIH